MKILIACEYSGTVRDAFRALGHEAMSCDLLPTEAPGPHYQGDIRDVLDYPWDMMIAHPPCTHLSVSGAKHFVEKRMDGRQQAGASFFMMLARAKIPRIVIENPVCIMSTLWRKPDQIIQPWQFGHGETKATCLWLINTPPCAHPILSKDENSAFSICRQAQTEGKSGQRRTPALPLQWLSSGEIFCTEQPPK